MIQIPILIHGVAQPAQFMATVIVLWEAITYKATTATWAILFVELGGIACATDQILVVAAVSTNEALTVDQ